ncbi:hypothetical protein [Streptomyces sp. TRM68416]|uniref:hypothetical protein n=1 Tax=Streptomyces sp. TRM68416 TaxID=2758412 RepID=UPI001661EF18|nr:hypothetical protein [Streptomyces sp. TRM68416]MBD0843143.1 hypothetical protein [Streptomyces sp. TRM68416]
MNEIHAVHLGPDGRLLEETARGLRPVPADRLLDHFAEELTPPEWATDVVVYAHGWRTPPGDARAMAEGLLGLADGQYRRQRELYPGLPEWRPWTVLLCWPSGARRGLGEYRRMRDRAHALSTDGHAGRVLGQLLGYVDARRGDPAAPPVLATREGQYLHLVGHSFGCRVLCEAVQWAAEGPATLGWSMPRPPDRPFTADSMLLFQMAAPRDAFATLFTALDAAPLHGPVVATYAQADLAAGFWHVRAEKGPGVGYAGIGTAPAPVSGIRMRGTGEPYPHDALDHRFVSVDASDVFVRRRGWSGAHSDHVRPESAHLLLSLAHHAR